MAEAPRSTAKGAGKDKNLNTLGRYSVLDDLGSPVQPGEGATVKWYKAFYRDLRCYTSLTVIAKSAFPTEESRDQFGREVQIAAGIRHPNLAAVFPLDRVDDNYVYA